MHRPATAPPPKGPRDLRPTRRALAPIAAAAVILTAAACGGEYTPSAGGRAAPVQTGAGTETTAPRPDITSSSPLPRSSSPKPPTTSTHTASARPKAQPDVHSDDVGRSFDIGVIVKVDHDKGVPVLVLDRWTVKGIPDATIARDGYPLAPHSGTHFSNINTRSTYRIPVARGARFTYQHCEDISKPMVTQRSTLRRLSDLSAKEQVVLVTLDAKGRATAVANDPAC